MELGYLARFGWERIRPEIRMLECVHGINAFVPVKLQELAKKGDK